MFLWILLYCSGYRFKCNLELFLYKAICSTFGNLSKAASHVMKQNALISEELVLERIALKDENILFLLFRVMTKSPKNRFI
jgi:hypothetical protein